MLFAYIIFENMHIAYNGSFNNTGLFKYFKQNACTKLSPAAERRTLFCSAIQLQKRTIENMGKLSDSG